MTLYFMLKIFHAWISVLTKAYHLSSTLLESSSTVVKYILSLSPVYSSACQLVLCAETFVFLDCHAVVAITKEST